jgi:hypothetical protein
LFAALNEGRVRSDASGAETFSGKARPTQAGLMRASPAQAETHPFAEENANIEGDRVQVPIPKEWNML